MLIEVKTNAELANQAKSEFLANMSHELRTPLNVVIGFAEVIKDEMIGPLNAEQDDALGEIIQSGKNLTTLIDYLLDLSRIEAGHETLEISEFFFPDLLAKCVRMFQEKVKVHSITLDLDIDESVKTIKGDERKISQVVLNLLSNAIKFTPDGGQIGIIARDVRDEVQITVWDTGIGIAEEDVPRLFQPFMRIATTLNKTIPGMALD